MGRLFNKYKTKIKHRMVLDHPYIKDKYFEYYVQHPGNGNADKIKELQRYFNLIIFIENKKGRRIKK